MPEHEEIMIEESAHLAVDRAPDPADAAPCNVAGPFRGARCTEPEGHVGDHQHHADGARAVWTGEG